MHYICLNSSTDGAARAESNWFELCRVATEEERSSTPELPNSKIFFTTNFTNYTNSLRRWLPTPNVGTANRGSALRAEMIQNYSQNDSKIRYWNYPLDTPYFVKF